jgi:hypothetical protein
MSLFQEGCKLYYRQMVAQLRINKDMCIFQTVFIILSILSRWEENMDVDPLENDLG